MPLTPEAGSIVANRFKLIREVGRGNMGAVWLADHLSLDVRCAVKLMSGAALREPTSRARFQLEAKAIAQLQSPYIVRVIDYDVHDDTPFIAMELLQGEELSVRLQRVGRLGMNATYRVVSQIALGLAKAHAAGIIHRDLKPENIFLAQTDEGEIAKLLDFGIAKTAFPLADTGTLDGTVLGTPQYMSPEQARGLSNIDHRSDLWSLAVVAYECLLGQMAFEGAALGDTFAKILAEPIPVPSRVAQPGVRIPAAFDRWWARAVSRDVEARFSSAQALTEALGKALGVGADGASDTTTPALDISSTGAVPQVEPPVRGRWRVPFLVAAVATAVGVSAVVANVRNDGGAATLSDGQGIHPAMAAVLPVAEERLPIAQPETTALPSPSSSAGPLPAGGSSEHALCDPDAHARSNVPPSSLSGAPFRAAAPARPFAGVPRHVAAARRPSDDVDFGI
jgi:serine/threonine protein kinase